MFLEDGAFALIMGWISGYPVGTKIAVNFRENNISSDGIVFFNSGINCLKRLNFLDLSWNSIGNEYIFSFTNKER